MPANARIQALNFWVPAFAGTTSLVMPANAGIQPLKCAH